MGHINKSSKLQKYGFLSFVMGARIFKSNSSVRQGAQIFRPIDFGLLTSQIKKAFAKHNGLVALQLLAVLAGGFLSLLSFSNSAYAASYVNVSSGGSGETAGVVSLGKIKPSSSGSTATGNDTLTVHTDCSAGYKVYVSGQNGKTTNLTNQSAEDPSNPSAADIISASSNTIASPNTLSSNTWGISGSSTDIENHLYAGLPAYSSATNASLVTKSDVEEESTVPIYYGVKADTTLNPGTYSGDILYTVLMDTSCIPYTVEFSPNVEDESEITGEMTNQSIMPNTSVTLNINTYERNGYFLLGWAEEPEGKTGTVTNGVGTEADIDYIDGEEITNVAIGGTTKTLYAIWAILDGEMQNFAGCSTLSDGDVRYLKDLRDGTAYRIKKIGDECWMTKNLILGYDKGYALTSELTNIPANDDGILSDGDTYYLPQAGYRGALDSSTTDGTTTFNGSNDSQAQVQYRAAGNAGDQNSHGILSQSTGYYNFYAATLGCSYYQDGNSNCYSGYTPRDICPKGWQLPAGGSDATKSWVSLDETLNSSSAGFNRTDIVARDKFLNDARFVYSGGYDSYQLFSVGMHGTWRSSTVSSSDNSYYLLLDSSGYVGVQDSRGKYLGFAVRCVAQSHYTVAYNANSGTGTAPAAQSVMENGSVTLQANTFARDGYNFLGWSTNASATTADYVASSAQDVNTIVSAAATAGQTTTDGSTITLYAVWEKNVEYMQDFICTNSSIASGETKTLVDKRDGQEYTVYRIPTNNAATDVAGKCIMTKDLNLGAVNSVEGSSSTITANGTMTLSPEDSTFSTPTGSGESITVPTSNVTVSSSYSSTDSYSNKYYVANGAGNYAGRGYYSWGAAMVACPKGWRLPTQDELNNNSNWNASTTGISKAVNNNISTIQSSPWSFVIGGQYSNSGFSDALSSGLYWSSTQGGSDTSTRLTLKLYNGLRYYSGDKHRGYAVRCIARNNYIVSYSANGGTGSASKRSDAIYDTGEVTTAAQGTLGKEGRYFHGWSLNPDATSVGYAANTAVDIPTLIAAAGSPAIGSTITLYAVWGEEAIADCSSGLHPTASTPCKMADGKTWILGNNGNGTQWSLSANESKCPSGYTFPAITNFDTLIRAYGGASYYDYRSGYKESTGALYRVLGRSGVYWSSTQYYSGYIYRLAVSSSSSDSSRYSSMSSDSYVLCYK